MAKKTDTIQIKEILRGCTPGRIQSVGWMQVIPIVGDIEDDRFVSPKNAKIRTSGYGSVEFSNDSTKTVIVPPQTAYVVNQNAQDHAVLHADIIAAKKKKAISDAVCIQAGQAGLIAADKHQMAILPFPLRESAHGVRRSGEYSRMWQHITVLNNKAGIMGDRGNLVVFLKAYEKQLDQFVAEFEPVPNQLGAIILINGKVVGIEKTPNYEYWLDVWKPLIRDCYGSLAVLEAKEHGNPPAPKTRVPINTEVKSLEDLRKAFKQANKNEYELVKDIVNGICEIDMSRNYDDKSGGFTIESLNHNRFVGEIVREDEKVLFGSLVATSTWKKHEDWFKSSQFKM